MRCCWLERKLMLLFFHTGEFSCRRFSLRERISKQQCFATYQLLQWCWCMDQSFTVFQEALCEALCSSCSSHAPSGHQGVRWLRKRDRISSRCSQVFSVSPRVFEISSAFSTSGWRCALRFEGQRWPWNLIWGQFKPSSNLKPIKFWFPKTARQVAPVPAYN